MPSPSKRHELETPVQLRALAGNWIATASRWRFKKPMTLQEAKSIARHLGLTLRQVRSGDYRVNFRDGNETTAYYTDNLEDAVNTAVEMARKRDCEMPHRAE